jgi:hypothetical protein
VPCLRDDAGAGLCLSSADFGSQGMQLVAASAREGDLLRPFPSLRSRIAICELARSGSPARLFDCRGVRATMLAVFFIINQPVNTVVAEWTPAASPADWATTGSAGSLPIGGSRLFESPAHPKVAHHTACRAVACGQYDQSSSPVIACHATGPSGWVPSGHDGRVVAANLLSGDSAQRQARRSSMATQAACRHGT